MMRFCFSFLMLFALVINCHAGNEFDDMFKLTSDIQIGDYQYNGVVDLEHESSWNILTDKCTITFPRRVEWKGKNIAFGDSPLIQRGQKVNVDLGYDFQDKSVFEGYVHQIHAKTPVRVDCQDAAWLLKQSTKTISYKDVTLRQLLSDVLPQGMSFEVNNLSLGSFRISKASPAQVLAKIKKTYFQKSFFRDGKLYCGFAYVPKLQSTHLIDFERHVVDNDLEYLRKEDVRIKLKAISMLPNNKTIEVEVGDPDGEQRTLHQYNVSEKVLRSIAEQEIERMRFEGYRGSMTIFGQPFVQHGDKLDLVDASYPERDGAYLVKRVVSSFGNNGYRQRLDLDIKV